MTLAGPTDAPLSQREFDTLMAALPRAAAAPRVAVAVSGGPDSMALALLGADWAGARGIGFTAITVDHGLRRESSDEARAVGEWLAARGIGHFVLRWRESPRGNVQAAARRARYALLEGWCADHDIPALLLAHHLEDQAETVLLRLARGSGVYGLAGMAAETAPAWPGAPARLRPLLDVPKARLAATLRAAGQGWVEDPSNRDEAFARVRVRGLWSELASLGITPERLAGTARAMARARSALDGEAFALIAAACEFAPGGYCMLLLAPVRDAPEEIALRALALLLMAVGGGDYAPRFERLERLWAVIRAGGPAAGLTLGGCRIAPLEADRALITREARGMQGPLALAAKPLLWDGRFLAAGAGLTIDRLGAAGLAALRGEGGGHALDAVPAAARVVLPALYDRRGLAAVPALGYHRADARTEGATLAFVPRGIRAAPAVSR